MYNTTIGVRLSQRGIDLSLRVHRDRQGRYAKVVFYFYKYVVRTHSMVADRGRKKHKNKCQRPELWRGGQPDNNGNKFTFAVFAFGYNFAVVDFRPVFTDKTRKLSIYYYTLM